MKMTRSALVVAGLFVAGCATVTDAGYYWGNYSQTLYQYTKFPSDETLARHVTELEEIISKSNEKGLKVPPGIHAELGYIQARQGNNTAAMAHYESEMKLYPESQVFLERLTSAN